MKKTGHVLGMIWAVGLASGMAVADSAAQTFVKPKPEVTFKPQEMADALQAVIAANREVYARYLEGQMTNAVRGTGGWTSVPVPEHFLRQASEVIQTKGAEFHYVLRSLWPINPQNAPATPTEQAGLRQVAERPGANYYAEESLGGRRYFTAVYADRAVVESCAGCHNAHPGSPRRDFKKGGVMGGLVVRVPLEF